MFVSFTVTLNKSVESQASGKVPSPKRAVGAVLDGVRIVFLRVNCQECFSVFVSQPSFKCIPYFVPTVASPHLSANHLSALLSINSLCVNHFLSVYTSILCISTTF